MEVRSEKLVYTSIRALAPAEVDEIVSRGNRDELRYVAISVSMLSDDFDLGQSICLLLARHPDSTVRGNAVQSFGHLARRFRRLDLEVVEPIYRSALHDSDQYVREEADGMLGEIRHYLALLPNWPEEEEGGDK